MLSLKSVCVCVCVCVCVYNIYLFLACQVSGGMQDFQSCVGFSLGVTYGLRSPETCGILVLRPGIKPISLTLE